MHYFRRSPTEAVLSTNHGSYKNVLFIYINLLNAEIFKVIIYHGCGMDDVEDLQ